MSQLPMAHLTTGPLTAVGIQDTIFTDKGHCALASWEA